LHVPHDCAALATIIIIHTIIIFIIITICDGFAAAAASVSPTSFVVRMRHFSLSAAGEAKQQQLQHL
jgi:hypothetical protein